MAFLFCKDLEYIRWERGIIAKAGFYHYIFSDKNNKTVIFIAFPGGNRNTDGSFNNSSNNGNWWSATENSGTNAWNRNLNYNDAQVNRNDNNKPNGFSARCVKD